MDHAGKESAMWHESACLKTHNPLKPSVYTFMDYC